MLAAAFVLNCSDPVYAAEDKTYFDVGQLQLDQPCAPEVAEPRRAKLLHQNLKGFWVHEAVYRCMISRLGVMPKLADRVKLLEDRKQLVTDQLKLKDEEIVLADKEATIATNHLEISYKLQRQAEEDRDAFFSGKPVAWLAIGGAIVVVLEVGAILLFKNIK